MLALALRKVALYIDNVLLGNDIKANESKIIKPPTILDKLRGN